MYRVAPQLARLDSLTPADTSGLAALAGRQGAMASEPFARAFSDFYLSNPIARASSIMGLRAVDVGALTNAGPLEGITAVLATINRRYKLKNSGIKITGLPA